MNILLNDPPRMRREGASEFVLLEYIKQESDIITFHVPLTIEGQDKTFHIVNEKFFDSIRRRVHLINTSRGEVIDGNALKKAIDSGRLGSAVLDVWENEPLIDKDLLQMVTIGTPHIAGYSTDGKANGTKMSVRSLSKFFGLGLDNWSVNSLSEFSDNKMVINAAGKKQETIISEAVLRTYNVLDDDAIFRKSISSFEEQREHYRPRREYGAYTINLLNDKDNIGTVLTELGFIVNGNSGIRNL